MNSTSDNTTAPGPAGRDAGWTGTFPEFLARTNHELFDALRSFVATPGALQEEAWKNSLSWLRGEVSEILSADQRATLYSLLMEYLIPLELRRSDVVMLVANGVVVVELKSKRVPSSADIDQVAAYARDLRAYHRECATVPVHAVIVPMGHTAGRQEVDGVWICPPRDLDRLVAELTGSGSPRILTLAEFLHQDAFHPLPTLIQAARQLFNSGTLPQVWRARASTEPAVEYIARVAHVAAATKTRHLVLVTGTPGAGKTLVGMRAVHSHYLDDLAVPRNKGEKAVPALFLSGNQPLVEVLQHVLRDAGGGGKTFVRHIKSYLNTYVTRPERVPPEHLLVFDEAQRAFTPDKVHAIHEDWPLDLVASEPELFIRICERMPEWSVLVGLIGSGQEIYLGEEGGLSQWRTALEASPHRQAWTVHAPAKVEEVFANSTVQTTWAPELHLDTQLRFHTASSWHRVVDMLLAADGGSAEIVREPLARVYDEGQNAFKIRLTRDLSVARQYMHERYADSPEARYGMLASSRDKLLKDFGIPNLFPDYSRIRVGKWFADGEEAVESCRHLTTCVTEFQCQGLELDMALLAWGSDYVRKDGRWNSALSRKFLKGAVPVRDAHALRLNSYRVLLTRGRDGAVVFIPPHKLLDETWAYLRSCGFAELTAQMQGS